MVHRPPWTGMLPDTWVGPIKKEEECQDTMNAKRGFRWNFREPGSEDWMVRLLATDPSVWGMAEQFLGEGKPTDAQWDSRHLLHAPLRR